MVRISSIPRRELVGPLAGGWYVYGPYWVKAEPGMYVGYSKGQPVAHSDTLSDVCIKLDKRKSGD